MERTCVIIKPDGVLRGICGDIITRFEKCGLKIVAMKLVQADRDLITKHYPSDEAWFRLLGQKAKKGYEERGMKLDMDDLAAGKRVKEFLVSYMTLGPVLAMVLEGNNAIGVVRRLVGATNPGQAEAGTIRGDYTMDDIALSFSSDRAVRNIIHASGDAKEAENEIKLWFKPNEIAKYKRCDTAVIVGEKE